MGDKKGQGYLKYVFGAYIYVICAFLGAILFIILFIFAKRQIMRFALRSRRGPHFPIGHDAKKVIRIMLFNVRVKPTCITHFH